ncbi:hypothetical protein QBC35DRAFT_509628 [Podospora australis]|uniref:BZIP domain-containing protein n=1 Tax=Podospora australis TaxID=1536484 RepID=A0AAN6WJW8_9PEZI|nr:hypothetical protein QBC35DRAFT_509628 [Podospora australis]
MDPQFQVGQDQKWQSTLIMPVGYYGQQAELWGAPVVEAVDHQYSIIPTWSDGGYWEENTITGCVAFESLHGGNLYSMGSFNDHGIPLSPLEDPSGQAGSWSISSPAVPFKGIAPIPQTIPFYPNSGMSAGQLDQQLGGLEPVVEPVMESPAESNYRHHSNTTTPRPIDKGKARETVSPYDYSPVNSSTASYFPSPQSSSSWSQFSSSAAPRTPSLVGKSSNNNSGYGGSQQPAAAESSSRKDMTNREKNCVAARKSRNKRSLMVQSLRHHAETSTEERQRLLAMAAALQEEVYSLRCQMRRHANCDCTLIQTYLNCTDLVAPGKCA